MSTPHQATVASPPDELVQQLLSSSTPDEQQQAIGAVTLWIQALVGHETEYSEGQVSNDCREGCAIGSRNAFTTSHHPPARPSLTQTLTHTYHPLWPQEKLVKAGIIPPLVQHLASDSAEMPEQAMRLLSLLTDGSMANAARTAAAGAIAHLVALLEPSSVRCHPRAVRLLQQMSVAGRGYDAQIAAVGGITPLIRMLQPDYDTVVHELAAKLFAQLATNAHNRTPMLQAGAVPALALLLRSNDKKVTKVYAATALANIYAAFDHHDGAWTQQHPLEMYLDDAISTVPLLVRLLEPYATWELDPGRKGLVPGNFCPDAAGRILLDPALRALSHLSSIRGSFQDAIVRHGAVVPLIHLMRSVAVNAEVQAQAARVLGHLSDYAKDRASLVAAGVVPPLVRLLASESAAVQAEAARTLGNIAAYDDGQGRVHISAEPSAVPSLVQLLLSSSAKSVQIQAARMLGKLAANSPDLQSSIIASGAIDPIMRLLQSSSVAVQQQAALVLGDLVELCADNQSRFAAAGAIGILVKLLQSSSAVAQQAAAAALKCLAGGHPDNQVKIGAAGAIPLLANMMRFGSPASGQLTALQAIGHLTVNAGNHSELTAADVILAMAQLLVYQSPSDVELLAMRVLSAPPDGCADAYRRAVMAAGAFQPLFTMLHSISAAPEPRVSAAVALIGTLHASLQTKIVESAGINRLVQLIRYSSSAPLQEQAVDALVIRTANENGFSGGAEMAAAGAIAPLVQLLLSRVSTAAQWQTVRLLGHLASETPDIQEAVAASIAADDTSSAGIIGSLWQLLQSSSDQTQVLGALIVLTAPANNDTVYWMRVSATAGAIPFLVEQLRSGSARTQGQSAYALACMTANSSQSQIEVEEAAGIAPLVSLIQEQSSPEEVQVYAVRVLSNLATHPGNRDKIAEASAITPLVHLLQPSLSPSSAELQQDTAQALANLATSHVVNALEIVAAGAIPLLVVLAASGSTASVESADAALDRLLTNALDEAIPPLVKLLSGPASALQRLAVFYLRQVTADAGNLAKVAAAGAIPFMLLMLQSNSDSSLEEACLLLASLAADSDARTAINAADGAAVSLLLSKLLQHQGAHIRTPQSVLVAARAALTALRGDEADRNARELLAEEEAEQAAVTAKIKARAQKKKKNAAGSGASAPHAGKAASTSATAMGRGEASTAAAAPGASASTEIAEGGSTPRVESEPETSDYEAREEEDDSALVTALAAAGLSRKAVHKRVPPRRQLPPAPPPPVTSQLPSAGIHMGSDPPVSPSGPPCPPSPSGSGWVAVSSRSAANARGAGAQITNTVSEAQLPMGATAGGSSSGATISLSTGATAGGKPAGQAVVWSTGSQPLPVRGNTPSSSSQQAAESTEARAEAANALQHVSARIQQCPTGPRPHTPLPAAGSGVAQSPAAAAAARVHILGRSAWGNTQVIAAVAVAQTTSVAISISGGPAARSGGSGGSAGSGSSGASLAPAASNAPPTASLVALPAGATPSPKEGGRIPGGSAQRQGGSGQGGSGAQGQGAGGGSNGSLKGLSDSIGVNPAVAKMSPPAAAAARCVNHVADEEECELCEVCMEAPLSIMLAPCGHIVLCYGCYEGIKGMDNQVRLPALSRWVIITISSFLSQALSSHASCKFRSTGI